MQIQHVDHREFLVKFPREVDLYDLREAILGIEQWIGMLYSIECSILDEKDLKG